MARKKRCSPSHFTVGNCKIEVDGGGVSWKTPNAESIAITCSKKTKINISVNDPEAATHNGETLPEDPTASLGPHDTGKKIVPVEDFHFHLVNPDNMHDQSKSLIQEILKFYTNELPSMNYVANTGRKSSFLKRCVSNGKYKTLALSLNSIEGSEEVDILESYLVIAAISFQILPVNTLFAEIPLAAVSLKFQHKGFGCLLYKELRKRLKNIGVVTIFCWADKASEGFWLKQGFSSIGTVNCEGRIEKLPVKADIRKALCFPGDSTLMVADTRSQSIFSAGPGRTGMHLTSKLSAKALVTSRTSMCKKLRDSCNGSQSDFGKEPTNDIANLCTEKAVPELLITGVECKTFHIDIGEEGDHSAGAEQSAYFRQSIRKRSWETSVSSLMSKRIKAGCSLDCSKPSSHDFPWGNMNKFVVSATTENPPHCNPNSHVQGSTEDKYRSINELNCKDPKIMLMNIADQAKKEYLAKIIENLGGSVTSDGTLCTHVVTGKARRTMNFCIALCSGAWVLSSNWLKESHRMGIFQDENKFLLEDPDYCLRYRAELSEAVAKARKNPGSLLKGYQICISRHVQPCHSVLSPIIESAGGTVTRELDDMVEPSTTIFLTCEEDIDEALEASKQGIRTFGSEWFMSCIMKQEFDFEAPQFAESL